MGAVGRCDLGKVRVNNEDSIYISENPNTDFEYYIVADGMGGHNGGDVASRASIKYFNEYIETNLPQRNLEDILDIFVEAVSFCNKKIFDIAEEDASLKGMGTTFTAAAVHEGRLFCVHIGDSRLYIFDKNGLKQLTKDHSFVMEMVRMGKITLDEARNHPKKNMITKAVGIEETMPADTIVCFLEEDSIILLCSDGLANMVTDNEIEKILKKKSNLASKADMLVKLANKNGGYDNISVILADRRVENQ